MGAPGCGGAERSARVGTGKRDSGRQAAGEKDDAIRARPAASLGDARSGRRSVNQINRLTNG